MNDEVADRCLCDMAEDVKDKELRKVKAMQAVVAGMFLCASADAAVTASRSEDVAKLIPQEADARRWERMKWWTDTRFGIFPHFGIYSLAARYEKVILHEVCGADGEAPRRVLPL